MIPGRRSSDDLPAVLLGTSPRIEAVREAIRELLSRPSASRPFGLLIEGETGSGKSTLARWLHECSARADRNFVEILFGQIPDDIQEYELFGGSPPAWVAAPADPPDHPLKAALERLGVCDIANTPIHRAHGGTLLLEDVGLATRALQARLLSAIDERGIRSAGRALPFDAWVISSTHSGHLTRDVRAGRFREDLYARLAEVCIELPPLRERGEDLLLLAEHVLARSCRTWGGPLKKLGPDVPPALLGYLWPGNLRELAAQMDRVARDHVGAAVNAKDLDLPEGLTWTRKP